MAVRCCALGVQYQTLARATKATEPGWNSRLPCWGRTSEAGAYPCVRYEQMEDAAQKLLETRLAAAARGLVPLVTDIQASFRGVGTAEGRAPCPSGCGGVVSWVLKREPNGRESCSGQCETPDCVRWLA